MEKEIETHKITSNCGRIELNCNRQNFFKKMKEHPHIFFSSLSLDIPEYLKEYFIAKINNNSFHLYVVKRQVNVPTYIFKGKIIQDNKDRILIEYDISRNITSYLFGIISSSFLGMILLSTFVSDFYSGLMMWLFRFLLIIPIVLLLYLSFMSNTDSRDKAKDLFVELYGQYII